MRSRGGALVLATALAIVGITCVIYGAADATCAARGSADVRWISTLSPSERAASDRWCAAVGAPVRISGLRPSDVFTGRFAIVSWNTHVGAGNLEHLVADLRAGRLTGGTPVTQFVLLLQEVYRTGEDVPVTGTRLVWASAQQPPRSEGPREAIAVLARRLGLDAIYVPSMRNGAPLATREDRGNAILSTARLAAITAIELPFESQRRVALETQVQVRTPSGADVGVTIVNTHFTNMVMHHLWVLSESGRMRQARALAGVLPSSGPLIVGGDFNAWFGFHDAAYKQMARLAGPAPHQDRRATFGPMRLDHLLFRLPDGWNATVRRGGSKYGSDHYPLIALVEPR